MSNENDPIEALVDIAVDADFSPTKLPAKLAGKFVKRWFKGYDFEKEIANWLLEGPVYLRRVMDEQIEQIRAAKTSPLEAKIIAEQVIEEQARASGMAKKELLAHVAVNGLLRPDFDAVKKRLFWRAVRQLEPEHVALAKEILRIVDLPQREEFYAKAHTNTLAQELQSFGFATVYRDNSMGNRAGGVKMALVRNFLPGGVDRWLSITPLGVEFLDFTTAPVPE